MDFAELLEKDLRGLTQMRKDLKMEYMNLRFLSRTTQEVKSSALRACRRNIARVETRLTQLRGEK